MPSANDLHIYVTGVVGRAMSSGKFTPDDILILTEKAYNAYVAIFGKPEMQPTVQETYRTGAPVVLNPGAITGNEPGPAEGKPFQLWAGDKLMGKKTSPTGKPWGEVSWSEAHQLLTSGNAQAVGYVEFLRDLALKGDRWDNANRSIKARAASILQSVGK